jgi:hypothetical protein
MVTSATSAVLVECKSLVDTAHNAGSRTYSLVGPNVSDDQLGPEAKIRTQLLHAGINQLDSGRGRGLR